MPSVAYLALVQGAGVLSIGQTATAPAADNPPPAAVGGLTLTPLQNGLRLTWTANTEPDLFGYVVRRATSPAGPYTPLATRTPAQLTYDDLTAAANTTYWYMVTAVDTASQESGVAIVSGKYVVDLVPPAPPTTLSATGTLAGVDLVWTDTDGSAVKFTVKRSDTLGGAQTLLSFRQAGFTFTDTTGTAGQTYFYFVSALDVSNNESQQTAVSGKRLLPVADPTQIRVKWKGTMAPAAVHVDLLNVYTRDVALDCHFVWDGGDPSNLDNRIVGPTPQAAFWYASPGTYTISCTVTKADGTVVVHKVSIDLAVNTRTTYFVDPVAGNDANAGTTSAAPIRTFAKALSKLTGNNIAILFLAGSSNHCLAIAGVKPSGNNVHIGTYGGTAKATLWYDANGTWQTFFQPSGSNFTMENVVLRQGAGSVTNQLDIFAPNGGSNYAMRNCDFGECNYAIKTTDFVQAVTTPGSPTAPGVANDHKKAVARTSRGGLLVLRCGTVAANLNKNYFWYGGGEDLAAISNTTLDAGWHTYRGHGFLGWLIYNCDITNGNRETIVMHEGDGTYVVGGASRNGLGIDFGPLGENDGITHDITSYVRYFVLDGVTITNQAVQLDHGLQYGRITNNNFVESGYTCINFRYDPHYYALDSNRVIKDVLVAHNTGYVATNAFCWFATTENRSRTSTSIGPVYVPATYDVGQRIDFVNNFFRAPGMKPGSKLSASLKLDNYRMTILTPAAVVGMIRKCENNLWALPASFDAFAQSGLMYVWNDQGSNSQGYRTAAEWNSLEPMASGAGDSFSNTVTISGGLLPVPVQLKPRINEVRFDKNGTPRGVTTNLGCIA